MQIQRLQSLYLLVATILTAAFCVPAAGSVVLLIFNITIAVLLVITIFSFRNLRFQIKLTKVDIALLFGSIITTIIYMYTGNGSYQEFAGEAILLVLAVGFAFAALSRMKRDKKLLDSANRLF